MEALDFALLAAAFRKDAGRGFLLAPAAGFSVGAYAP